MFSRILLHGLEPVLLAAVLVLRLFKKLSRLLAHLQHPVRRKSKHLRYSRNLVVFGGAGEKRQTEEEFDNDTSQGPHIDGGRVWQAEQDFWGPVESRLDVRVYGLAFVARRTKIDNLDNRAFEAGTRLAMCYDPNAAVRTS